MNEEMRVLGERKKSDLGNVGRQKKSWVVNGFFTIKYKADGTSDRYKVRLVAKGYTQTYGIDCYKMFALVVKMNTI